MTKCSWVLATIGLNLMLFVPSFQKSSDPTQTPSGPACSSTADDADIYSAVIHGTLLKEENGQSRVVLFAQTSAGYPPGMAASTSFGAKARKELLDSAAAETKSDFDARAKLHCEVTKSIEPQGRIIFVTAKEVEPLFATHSGGWDAFQKKYPDAVGFTIVSAIGFSTSHDQALVYLGNSCGILCGSGYFVLLQKKDGKWEVQSIANIWVS
jgi:hypothetical protein